MPDRSPADLLTAAQQLRTHGDHRLANEFIAPIATWLERTASAWSALIVAAGAGLDPSDPVQAEAAEKLKAGPYDAAEAVALARLLLAEVSS